MENDEVVIDLRVLMWEILRKWHIILVVCIIFAIASAMFGIHRNKAQSVEVSPENLYEQLKPAEIVKVNNLVSIQKRIDEKTEYEKNSIYMSLNAYDVDVARTDFILSDNPDNKYIRQMYTTYMFEGGLYNDIIKEYSDDISLENLSELVKITLSERKVNVNEDSEENYYKGNDLNRVISVRILGRDKKQCQELQSLVIKNVKQYEKNVQSKYNNHSIKEVSSNVYKAVDTDIASVKSTYDSQMYSLYNEYQSLYNALSDIQISLFDKLINEEEDEDVTEEKPEAVQPASGGISLKYVIVGILAGGFLSVVVVVLLTMFNGKIFVQRQITDRGLARVFGTFGKNKNNIASVVLGDVGTDKTSQLDIIVAKVDVFCKKNDITELVIIDNCTTETGKSRMKSVDDRIQQSGKD